MPIRITEIKAILKKKSGGWGVRKRIKIKS
jgi:hypothetical protein